MRIAWDEHAAALVIRAHLTGRARQPFLKIELRDGRHVDVETNFDIEL